MEQAWNRPGKTAPRKITAANRVIMVVFVMALWFPGPFGFVKLLNGGIRFFAGGSHPRREG